jgi:hypothetical protein
MSSLQFEALSGVVVQDVAWLTSPESMCGPCARKDEMSEKTKFCTEGCCTPKTFSDIWWGIWTFFIALQIISFFFAHVTLG